MKKNLHFLFQFFSILVFLAAILLQSFTHMVKTRPLDGFTDEVEKDTLTVATYLDGSYQNFLTEYAKQNTGFREFFIRTYNQTMYSCFDKITNNNIVKGRNNELYMTMYLNDVTGKDVLKVFGGVEEAKAEAEKNVEATLELIEVLRQHNTKFLFVFCPSKTAVYPEYMPQKYRNQIADFQLEEYYIELFKEKGIPHIDFYHYFQQIKDEFPYPLYTKTGTHWAESTMPMVCDSIYRKIEEITGCHLPSIEVQDLNICTDYSIIDGELEANLNLLFPLQKPAVPNPVFTLKDTVGKDRINLLVTGDSYFNQLRRSSFVNAFNKWDYWLYNKTIHSSQPFYNGKNMDMVFDANEVIEEADIVITMFTTAFMTDYMCGFIPFAEQQLQNNGYSDEEAVAMIIQNIKKNPDWYQKVVEQAEQHNITVEENLRNNAVYVLQNMKKAKQEMAK